MPFDRAMFIRALELSNEYFIAGDMAYRLWQKRDKTRRARIEGRTCRKHNDEWQESSRMRKHALRKGAQLRMKAFGKCRSTMDILANMFEVHRGRSGYTGKEAHKYIIHPSQFDALADCMGNIEDYFDGRQRPA